MRPTQKNSKYRRPQAGFSLPELMVGMVIAIISSVAIFASYSNFDWQKTRTVSGTEAQENGLTSMSVIEQDLHNAGAGMSDPAQLSCTSIYANVDGTPIAGINFSPVRVTDGGASGSDQLTIQSSSNFVGSLSTFLQSTYASSSTSMTVLRSIGYQPGAIGLADGSMGLISDGTNCTVFEITGNLYGGSALQTDTAGPSPNYNPSPGYKLTNAWPAYGVGAKIFDISGMHGRTYSINAQNQLQVVDSSPWAASSTTILAENVVMIKAQYGIAPAGTSNVNDWVSATGSTWASPTVANRNRIKAIRLAVIARSKFPEGQVVTPTCTNNSGVVNTGPCVWPDTSADPAPQIDLSAGNANWNKYRYKIYQTIIPLRNVIWAGV